MCVNLVLISALSIVYFCGHIIIGVNGQHSHVNPGPITGESKKLNSKIPACFNISLWKKKMQRVSFGACINFVDFMHRVNAVSKKIDQYRHRAESLT